MESVMWKLTTEQKRKYEHTDGFYTDKVEFVAKNIEELALMLVKMSRYENGVETSYRLERVGEVNE